VLDRGQLSYPEEGTPQGGVISPLLANIYLHYVLDCWYVESVKPRMKGRTFLVRFADDFILGFENKEDAEKVYRVLFRRSNSHFDIGAGWLEHVPTEAGCRLVRLAEKYFPFFLDSIFPSRYLLARGPGTEHSGADDPPRGYWLDSSRARGTCGD